MSNAKVQMSNQIQITNEMPKQVRHDEAAILNLAFKQVQGLRFRNPILSFDIPLTFRF
jgi:stringent starvation protein B